MSKMRITESKGVHFTHDNGMTLSIQIGGGNYSDNYDEPIGANLFDREYVLPASRTAEIAIWGDDGDMADIGGDTVKGYVPVADVLRFNTFLSELPSGLSKAEVEEAVKAFDWRDQAAA